MYRTCIDFSHFSDYRPKWERKSKRRKRDKSAKIKCSHCLHTPLRGISIALAEHVWRDHECDEYCVHRLLLSLSLFENAAWTLVSTKAVPATAFGSTACAHRPRHSRWVDSIHLAYIYAKQPQQYIFNRINYYPYQLHSAPSVPAYKQLNAKKPLLHSWCAHSLSLARTFYLAPRVCACVYVAPCRIALTAHRVHRTRTFREYVWFGLVWFGRVCECVWVSARVRPLKYVFFPPVIRKPSEWNLMLVFGC